MSETTDALHALLASEGWRILCALARREWAERERTGRRHALGDTDDGRALDKLRQITAAQEAVEWVLELPEQEVARLTRQEFDASPSMERRPVGPPLAGMSRRGTL